MVGPGSVVILVDGQVTGNRVSLLLLASRRQGPHKERAEGVEGKDVFSDRRDGQIRVVFCPTVRPVLVTLGLKHGGY